MGLKVAEVLADNEIYSPVEEAKLPRIFVCFLKVAKHQKAFASPSDREPFPVSFNMTSRGLSFKLVSPRPARQQLHLSKTSIFFLNSLKMIVPSFNILVAPSRTLPLNG